MRLLWVLLISITSCHSGSTQIKSGDTLKANTVIPVNTTLQKVDSLLKTPQQPLTETEQGLVEAGEDEDDDLSRQDKDLHYVNKNKVFIVFADGKKIRLYDYFKDPSQLDQLKNEYLPWGGPSLYGKLDFDHDGKEELLLTFIPSAGRWSTTQYCIFEPIAPHTFKFTATLGTGSSEDYRKKEKFSLGMGGKLIGGFFTNDLTEDYPEKGDVLKYHDLTYTYKNNHFVLKNNHKKLTKDILFNLKWMQKNSSCDTVTVQEEGKYIGNDDGFRRVFSYDIVSYYLMTKSFPKTKKLFYIYYPCTDKDRVWKELKAKIKSLMKYNTF